MAREHIETELNDLIDDLAAYALETFRPGRAALGVSIPGGNSIKAVLDDHADAALDEIRADMETQIELVLSYAEDCAAGDTDPEPYLDDFYATNPVMQRVDRYRDREELADKLGQHFEELGQDMAPLMGTDADSYEEALQTALEHEEAKELVDAHLDQIEYFFEHRDAITFSETIGSGFLSKDIEYTEEALRVLRSAKEQARQQAYETIDAAYQSN